MAAAVWRRQGAWRAWAAPRGAPAAARSRGFGVEHEAQRLRLKGAAGRAFRREAPPRLPRKAVEHYVRVLKARGSSPSKQVVARAPSSPAARRDAELPAELTSEEKTQLVARYLPEEREMAKKLRKSCHKWLWRYMSHGRWSRYDSCVEQLRAHQLPYDEVTYNLSMFGVLLHPRCDDDGVQQLFSDMSEDGRFHPALLRLQGGFLESYFELKEVDAAPNRQNLLKIAKTFWEISVNFKRQRVRDLRKGLAAVALEQRAERLQQEGPQPHLGEGLGEHLLPDAGGGGARGQPGGGAADALWQDSPLDEGELSDGRHRPGGVRFPARRPRQVRGVHKGSGVPNRRAHRWRH